VSGPASGPYLLGGDEVSLADQRRVRGAGGDDPAVREVPALDRAVAEADVRGVGELQVGALPVPDLAAGVARVGQDRRNRRHDPPGAGTVRIPGAVGRRRARDARVVQRPGDPGRAVPGEPLGEHPPHHVLRLRVRLQPVGAAALGGVHLVRVRPRTRILVRTTSRLDDSPSTVIARSSCSELKSTGPPASGSHNWTR
jgi:hypothetical protein